jgi:hypothetical protein
MTSKYALEEVFIPENGKPGPKANIFMSEEFRNPTPANQEKSALVLIQGTGTVRAGIWANSVAVNDCLELGTMLP